jgi:hypothetical protein
MDIETGMIGQAGKVRASDANRVDILSIKRLVGSYARERYL